MILVFLVFMCCVFYWTSDLSLIPFPQWSESLVLEQGQKWLAGGSDLGSYQEPMLPFIVSVLNRIGFGGAHGLRLLGILGFFAFIYRLMTWMRAHRVYQNAPVWIWLVVSAVLFGTGLRSNITLIRPEIWLGYLWLSILIEIEKPEQTSHWRLARYFATAIYFRFESILWLIPILSGIIPYADLGEGGFLRRTSRRLFSVTWKTFLFLLPLVFSLGFHYFFRLFYSTISFPKLSASLNSAGAALPSPADSGTDVFFGLFLEYPGISDGSLAYLSKLGLFILFISAATGTIVSIARHFERKMTELGSRVTALLGLFLAFLMVKTSPSPESSAFFQYLLWPVVVIFISDWVVITPWTGTLTIRVLQPLYIVVLIALFLCQFASVYKLWGSTNRSQELSLDWEDYRHWVDCVETEAGRSRVWVQVGELDVTMEVLGRNPHRKVFLVNPRLPPAQRREVLSGFQSENSVTWIRTRYFANATPPVLNGRGPSHRICAVGSFWALLTERFEDFAQDASF